MELTGYLPQRVNSGRWLTWYTLEQLRALDASVEIVLPICSLGTPYPEIADLGELVTGAKPGRQTGSERTIACNLGLAMDDMAVAPTLFARAVEMGLGTWLPL